MSEIAQLLKQIETETIAMKQGLHGLSETARHEFISKKYNAIGCLRDSLVALAGDEANNMANDIMDAAITLVDAEQAVAQLKEVK